jgi:hypothetical protein
VRRKGPGVQRNKLRRTKGSWPFSASRAGTPQKEFVKNALTRREKYIMQSKEKHGRRSATA